jgi:potassium channel subfamily K
MLLAMGKCEQSDFDTVAARFNELDVNGDRTLDAKDLLGA